MKLPRNLSGEELVKKLKKLGYEPTRQVGSHIRLTTEQHGTHHVTIPSHKPLKIGTLSSVLKDVATHFEMSREGLLELLF